VLPEGQGRMYIARKLVRTVSVSGKAAMRPIAGGGTEVIDFDLESIDLARPRKAGMRTALVGGLTSEMETEEVEVKPEEIAALSANELRAHNPSLVTAIEDDVRKPLETKVSEQETEISELTEDQQQLVKVREALGIDDQADVLETVGSLMVKVKEIAKGAKDAVLDKVLTEKFKDENTRGLVKLALTSEMDSLEVEDESDESKKKVTEMVDGAVEKNEILRKMVGEQSSSGSTWQTTTVERGGTRKIEPGYEDSDISVRKARR